MQALFTEDARLDRMGTVFSGQAELGRFLAARPQDVTTRHLCTTIRVDFDADGDEATGCCYVLFFQGTAQSGSGVVPTALGPPSVVEYHDRFRRGPEGWRIQERQIRMGIQA